jgi:CubicO group peptidase (beta-lactamase class C family)
MNYFIFLIFLISLFINSINYELSQDRIKKLDEIINSLMKLAKLKTVGFIITNSTNTIYQNIYGEIDKVTTKSPFILGSVSKSFTALGLLNLNISLNQTLNNYDLNDYINEKDAKDITISELLNHSSGLDSFSSHCIYNKGYFNYSNYGFALLGKIIEKESNKKYEDYMSETIFKPLKMINTHASYHPDIIDSYDFFLGFRTKYRNIESEIGDGFYVPAGFISSSVEDMGNYLRFYLNKSEENQKYVKQMTEGNFSIGYNINYGMGMVIQKKNGQTIYHHNGDTNSFSSKLVIYPELDIGFFLVTNTRDSLCLGPREEFFEAIENYLILDSFDGLDNSSFFFNHFTYDIIFLFIIAIPLTYLIITIIRKIKLKKYSWFIGIKGKIIFGFDLFILVIAPIVFIIIFYTVNPTIKMAIDMIRDLKFIIFAPSSILFFIFLIKLGYFFAYNKLFNKYDLSNGNIENTDLDYIGVEE